MINNVGIIGAGSVGSVLISQLYPTYGDNFYLLASGERAERLRTNGLSINDHTFHPQIYSDASQNISLDLLIIAVKSYSLNSVIEDIRPLINKETIILPLLNGITATDTLQKNFPDNRVLYGVMIRTDAHRTGHKVYYITPGEVQLGYAYNNPPAPEVKEIRECLVDAGINANIYEDMKKIQWRKWMLNTGGGQAAVEIGVECGYFEQVDEIVEIIRLCMNEILELAKAEHVNITKQDRDEIIEFLVGYPAHKKMSMLQDVEAGRPIEIEEYAGTVIRLGEKHGIPTPANRFIYLSIMAKKKVSELKKHM
ncbi:MAG: ketopantoate reductase family protein [Lachnospiraceae bacterium]